VKLLDLDGNG